MAAHECSRGCRQGQSGELPAVKRLDPARHQTDGCRALRSPGAPSRPCASRRDATSSRRSEGHVERWTRPRPAPTARMMSMRERWLRSHWLSSGRTQIRSRGKMNDTPLAVDQAVGAQFDRGDAVLDSVDSALDPRLLGIEARTCCSDRRGRGSAGCRLPNWRQNGGTGNALRVIAARSRRASASQVGDPTSAKPAPSFARLRNRDHTFLAIDRHCGVQCS